ncbi:MAG: transcriptional regulator [Deltaproteobacteria bacterium]|nr:transcriptional regulator [Deltaproteobacteria bacterium]
MARGDQLARQWKIIQTLLASVNGKSAAQLADEIECHPRTVYRDLEALQNAGFPIYNERIEGKHLWAVLDAVKKQVPIPFSLTELMALYFGRDMLRFLHNTVFYDSIESLFQKIKTVLPPESEQFLASVQDTIAVSLKQHKDYSRFKETINQVHQAALQKQSIKISYFTMSSKTVTDRQVDPYRIYVINNTFYMVGYCHLRSDVRTFAFDRIKSVAATGVHFTIQDAFDPDAFLRNGFGVYHGTAQHIRIRFAPDIAGYIAETTWHESQKIQHLDDGSVLFEAQIAPSDELIHWIMGWGAKAEVLAPEDLRHRLSEEARALVKTYQPPP